MGARSSPVRGCCTLTSQDNFKAPPCGLCWRGVALWQCPIFLSLQMAALLASLSESQGWWLLIWQS